MARSYAAAAKLYLGAVLHNQTVEANSRQPSDQGDANDPYLETLLGLDRLRLNPPPSSATKPNRNSST
jgi:hypothetical protein